VPQHAKTGRAEVFAGRRSRGGGLFHAPIAESLAAVRQSVAGRRYDVFMRCNALTLNELPRTVDTIRACR
jgi:hypothetical protein